MELGVFVFPIEEPYLPFNFPKMGVLLLLSLLPVFVLLIDGYYQKQIKKSVLLILLFFALVLTGKVLLHAFGIGFALAVPIILFVVLVFSIKTKHVAKRKR